MSGDARRPHASDARLSLPISHQECTCMDERSPSLFPRRASRTRDSLAQVLSGDASVVSAVCWLPLFLRLASG